MLTFIKHYNINAKTRCNISGLNSSSKGVSLFNKNFVNLLNTLDLENTEVSEDSLEADNKIDEFTKVGLLR